jgi:ATP-binding cassette subfamily B protein
VISRLANNFQEGYTNTLVQKTSTDMFSDGLKHSLGLPYFEFQDQSSGETIGILTKVRKDIEGFVSAFVNVFFMALIGLVFVLVYSLFVSIKVTLLYIAAVPLIIFVSWYMSRRLKPLQEDIVSKTSELSGTATESLRNIELVKSLGLSGQQIDAIDGNNQDLLGLELHKIKLVRRLGFIQGTIINFIRSLMILVLLYLIFHKEVSAGQFFAFLMYAMFLFNPLQELGKVLQTAREAQVSLSRLDTIVAKPFEKQPDNPKGIEHIRCISFQDVGFVYPDKKEGIQHVSFVVRSGETIAFVGPSGSGKSTVIKLLVRLYSPSEGTICYDEVSSREIHKDDIRQRIGIVTQDTQLFSGTIRDNLLFVRPGATDEECMSVIDKGACRPLVERSGDGLNALLGESGMKVSGGERQRLAIARALLRNPDILIFDEATSALDSLTERDITHTIQDIAKSGEHITILIAHGLSTVKFANRIYVLDGGCIVEQGNHQELLDRNGLYADMWRQQIGEGE